MGVLSAAAIIPTNSTSETVGQSNIATDATFADWLASFPETFKEFHEDSLKELYDTGHGQSKDNHDPIEARALSKRVSMFKGKLYRIQGWVFSISFYLVEHWGGTSWVFPQDTDFASQNYIADQFATDVRSTIGDGTVENRAIGGGWSWSGNVNNGYEFNDIPYAVMYHTCINAIQGAVDWISVENGAAWQMLDTNGREIGFFQLFPTAYTRGRGPTHQHQG